MDFHTRLQKAVERGQRSRDAKSREEAAKALSEEECKRLLGLGESDGRHLLALPAYDQCIKASHMFNLLDARGVISVTERQSFILRVRELAKACGAAWLRTSGGGA